MIAKLLLPVSTMLLFAAPLGAADILHAERFTVTGQLIQQTADAKKPIKTVALSIKVLLGLFGRADVKPSAAKFFYDETTKSDVLASSDGQTIYGTLFTYKQTPTDIDGLNGSGMEAGPASMLNDNLQGTYSGAFRPTTKASTGFNSFIGYGMFGGVSTIIKGTFKYSEPN